MQNEKNYTTMNIDPEFKQLHLPISKEALKSLKETIERCGAIRPIKVWNGIIIDGHKHYRIYLKKSIRFAIKEYEFYNRFDAMAWICRQNLLRKNLTDEYRKYFIGKLFLLQYQSAVEEGIATSKAFAEPGTLYNRCLIAKDIGKSYGVSNTTINTYGQYADGIDKLYNKEPDIATRILTGKVRISVENTVRISQLSSDDLHILKNRFNKKENERLSMSEVWHEIKWSRTHTPTTPRKKHESEKAGIKIMPEYDPDAELSSLSLTIPSWKSSIERVKTVADFSQSSENAREVLLNQLSVLKDTIIQLSSYIKETENAKQCRAESESEQESLCTECTFRADTRKEPVVGSGIPA